jgi:hypothetical protein
MVQGNTVRGWAVASRRSATAVVPPAQAQPLRAIAAASGGSTGAVVRWDATTTIVPSVAPVTVGPVGLGGDVQGMGPYLYLTVGYPAVRTSTTVVDSARGAIEVGPTGVVEIGFVDDREWTITGQQGSGDIATFPAVPGTSIWSSVVSVSITKTDSSAVRNHATLTQWSDGAVTLARPPKAEWVTAYGATVQWSLGGNPGAGTPLVAGIRGRVPGGATAIVPVGAGTTVAVWELM